MAENDLDINSIASELLSSQVSRLFDGLLVKSKSWAEKVKLSFVSSFHTYVDKLVARYSRSRSFFNRNDPVFLYEFYVPIGVSCENHTVPSADASSIFPKAPHVVIQGSGGCGKSVLIRHLLLDILRIKGRIPIFVELRELNRNDEELSELVLRTLKESSLDIDSETLEYGIKEGTFAFLFDGYDELEGKRRIEVSKYIRSIAVNGPKNWIVVTSRPDNEFTGWAEFKIFAANPLTLELAVALVGKTPVEDELKKRFLAELQNSLFEKHKSFLSNPLLLSIMLLTYHDSADIPTKLSVFYTQAFDALFQRHDAWKGGYKRKRECNLDIHDFGRLFSGFAILTYDERLISMPKSTAISFIKKAARIVQISIDAEAFLQDCVQAVCLLVEDGLLISYSHRSFQEYFAARFVAEAPPEPKEELMHRIAGTTPRDNTIPLLYEMQPAFLEKHYLLPALDKEFDSIGMTSRRVTKEIWLRWLQLKYSRFSLMPDGNLLGIAAKDQTVRNAEMLAFNLCGHLVDFDKEVDRDSEAWKKFKEEHKGKRKDEFVMLKDLKVSDELALFIYKHGRRWSAKTLEVLWDIREKLSERSASAKKGIAELFGNTRGKGRGT